MECRENIFRLPLQQQQDRLLFYGKNWIPWDGWHLLGNFAAVGNANYFLWG